MQTKNRINLAVLFMSIALLPTDLFAKEIRVGLASDSALKKEAVEKAFRQLFPKDTISLRTHSVASEVAEQPVGLANGLHGARSRLKNFIEHSSGETNDYWVSIENFIEVPAQAQTPWVDQAVVLVQGKTAESVTEFSQTSSFNGKFGQLAQSKTSAEYAFQSSGYSVTVGELIQDDLAKRGDLVPRDDWQQHPEFGGISRKVLIQDAVIRAVIKTEISTIPDFPKKGILFRDMTPLIGNPDLFKAVIRQFAKEFEGKKIDLVAALDARGFILGAPLALAMNKPFIPIRKKGKLPKPTFVKSYSTEYSVDQIEISVDDLNGKTVLIVDDLLATGGTLQASEELFKNAGAGKIYSACLIELVGLNGKAKLKAPFFSLVQY